MHTTVSKFMNPFTDFGFKKLFGEEANKELLIDFLNEILREQEGDIKEITYLKNEQLGDSIIDRKAIFDVYCETDKGEKIIVEIQKAYQKYFKDRALYYSTIPIREQSKTNEWDFQLKKVYTISILDFEFTDSKTNINNEVKSVVKLVNTSTNELFYDKLTYIYLEMPKFKKTINQCTSHFDKWLFILKNLDQLEQIPPRLQEKIFMKVFETAEVAQLNKEDRTTYESSLKTYRDLKNSLDTAKEQGVEIGIQKGVQIGVEIGAREKEIEIIHKMLAQNVPFEFIQSLFGLSQTELEEILAKK